MGKITTIKFFLLLFCLPIITMGQSVWWSSESYDASVSLYQKKETSDFSFSINSTKLYEELQRIPSRFKNEQSVLLRFPSQNGGVNYYKIYKAEVLHPELQKKYPKLQSFVGQSTYNPLEKIRFTYHPLYGLNGILTTKDSEVLHIKRINKSSSKIIASKSEEFSNFDCETDALIKKLKPTSKSFSKNANDGNLRRYRLALAASGQYSQFFLDGTEVDDTERKVKVLAAMVSSINRVNGIFERDFSVTMQIIPDNDSLIYLDGNTDPFSTNLNSELQNAIDSNSLIGSSGYDVGHLFHVEGSIYGNAGCIACVCTDGSKGSAFTVHNDPSSDNFNLIVAHEFGHQFGGYHVQSSSNCRSGFNSEVEPGSGSTIMGYAGICSPDVQEGPDDYFNYVDIRDVAVWTISNSNCAEIIDISNTAPMVNAGSDHTIPRSTPFVLEGDASDINNGDLLTYCWEQNNPEDPFSSNTPQSNWVNGPLFRSWLPSESNKRYFPRLDDLISGNLSPTWEVLPSVARTMRFELTVRDNVLGGGQTNTDGLTLTVDDTSGPFLVTSQSIAETWNVGDQVTITWDVANTNIQPVNAANVDIYLSVDGGNTYPYLLQNNIANDGSETFILPNVESTSQARVMVKASENVFFAINNTDITVQASEFIVTSDNNSVSICQSENAVFDFQYRTFLDFDEETTFSTENLPLGITSNFTPLMISGQQVNGAFIGLTISNTATTPVGSYPFNIIGTSTSGIVKTLEATLNIYETGIAPVNLLSPENNSVAVNIENDFEWDGNENIEEYELQIATDDQFLSIIETTNTSEVIYRPQSLSYDNTYYWRVISRNPCGDDVSSSVNTFTTQCANPENFTYNGVGATYVNLIWEDLNSTNWDVQYGTSGFIIENGTIVNSDVNSIEINNLESLTSYDFYLRSTCSVGGLAPWIGPITISTTANYCAGDRFYDSGGPNGTYQNGEFETTVISPESNNDRVRVKFDAFELESCCDFLTIYDGPNTSASLIGSYSGISSPGVLISSHETGSLTFVFSSDGSVTASGWDVEVICEPKPNCSQPTNFTIDSVTAKNATLVWETDGNSSSWDVEYGFSGFQEGTGTIINTSQTTYVLDGLDPITQYDVYIRGNCSVGGVSDVVGPISFETLCDVVSAPFVESFELFNLPQCWNQFGSETWMFNRNASYDAANAGDRNTSGNTNYAWVDGSSPSGSNQISTMTLPLVDISGLLIPSIQFSVFSKNTIDNTYNTFRAEFYDGSVWNDIIELQENTNGWRDVAFDLSSYTITGPIQLRFTVIKNSPGNSEYNDILVDEIKIDELPSCLNPHSLLVSNQRSRSVDVSWSTSGLESNWELLYGPRGFSPSNATNQVVNTNPYEITTLEPQTEYELYIRSICAIGDTSEYIGPIFFTTPCDAYSAPFEEVFANYSRPSCWSEEGNSNWSFGRYYDSQLGREVEDRTEGNQTNYTWKNNNSSDPTVPSYLITPFIDVSSLVTPSVEFSINSNEIFNNEYNTLTVEFYDGASWNTLQNVQGSTNGWRDFYLDLSSYNITDDVQIRFSIIQNTNSSEYNYILIDDVRIGELPSCFNPYSLDVSSVSFNSATVNWVDDTNTNWQIEYGVSGFALGTGAVIDANTNEGVIENLTSGTDHQFYIRANCGAGDFSEWIGPADFKTLSNFCQGDRFYDSGGPTGNYQNGELETTHIAPESSDDRVRVSFDAFLLEGCCDYLRIYDGPDTSAPLIGSYNGSNSPGEIVSSHDTGSLTFVFASDGSVTYLGWDAEVICEPKPNCSIPSNFMLVDALAHEALLSWDSSTESNSWEIEYGLNGFILGNGTIVTADTNSILITELSANTSYEVYLKASCVAGGFSDSTKISFTTEVGCPDPSGVILSNAQSNSLSLNWDINSGNEQTWDLEYGESGFLLGSGISEQTNTNNIELNSLIANTFYDVYLRANCNNNDQSAWSGPYTFRTSCESAPNNPNEFISNGSFECGDFGSWRSFGPGSSSGCRMNFTVLENSLNVCVIVPEIYPVDGQFAAFTSFDGEAGDTYVLEQTISLPNDLTSASTAILSYNFLAEYDVSYATPSGERRLTVSFHDQNNNLIFDVNQITFGVNPLTGSIDRTMEEQVLDQLVAYEGQNVILRFSAYIPDSNSGPAKAMIDDVSLQIESPLSVEEEVAEDNLLRLLPNPSNGIFNIYYSGINILEQIQVFNLVGKLIYDQKINNFKVNKEIQLPIVESGVYLVRIVSNKTTITKRIVVKK
ncbi:reprolysin-like metallopeptidase [Aquimarina sp. MMG016]|uniref:fibronectin type III domain-containing protein n=1 Tax=Aquimarina sp. MMG016 TaxID=2822690 RepID=UPI001B39D5B1|nr:zinc-dependent metalloprotease family protein [Aquimarina sp. MMG016]MBQ4821045.1 T9SS type A sorting domain-containing protein [Aquimarina sp. MMG016]